MFHIYIKCKYRIWDWIQTRPRSQWNISQCKTEQDIWYLGCNEEEQEDHVVNVDAMVDITNYDHVVAEVFTEDIDINDRVIVQDNECSYNTGFIFANLESIPCQSQILMNLSILIADTGSKDIEHLIFKSIRDRLLRRGQTRT